MKFKIGDRIVVYGVVYSNGSPHGCTDSRNVAIVEGVPAADYNYISVRLQSDGRTATCNPKQCRLLKKPSRRTWVLQGHPSMCTRILAGPQLALDETVEVIEVRKKK